MRPPTGLGRSWGTCALSSLLPPFEGSRGAPFSQGCVRFGHQLLLISWFDCFHFSISWDPWKPYKLGMFSKFRKVYIPLSCGLGKGSNQNMNGWPHKKVSYQNEWMIPNVQFGLQLIETQHGWPSFCNPKVIGVLVCLIFAQKQLPFTEPLDHLEAFAGEQSVTLGEIEDIPFGCKQIISYLILNI